MEDTGAVVASASPVAESISSEIDSLFADAGTETPAVETESTPAETSAPNPQDSTVQPPSPTDFDPGDDAAEAEKPVKPAEPAAVEAAPPVADEDAPGEEYEARGGKKWIRYPEARGKEVFAGYQAAKTLQRELNLPGPVTPETVKTLAADKTILDAIDFDVMSTDPAEQARAFRYLFATAKKAFEGGHTSHNPHETMADALLHAASSSAPEVIKGIEQRVTQNTLNRLYEKAVAAGLDTQAGQDLLASVQRTDQALTGTFRKRADLGKAPAAPDALAQRAAEVEQRAQQIQEYESRQAAQEWDQFTSGTNTAIDTGVNGAIAHILQPVAASLKSFPETQKNVEIRLIQEIKESIAQDQKFGIERDRCFKQASIAGSESVRDGWRARIIQLYTAKAEAVLRVKAPAILSESAQALKAKSDKTHERLKGTQQLRGTPAGGTAPNGATAPGSSGGKFDSRSWAQEFESAFN